MIEEFLRYITAELQLSPQTVDAYRTDLNQWSDFATSGGAYDLRPETTTLSDLRLWIAQVWCAHSDCGFPGSTACTSCTL